MVALPRVKGWRILIPRGERRKEGERNKNAVSGGKRASQITWMRKQTRGA